MVRTTRQAVVGKMACLPTGTDARNRLARIAGLGRLRALLPPSRVTGATRSLTALTARSLFHWERRRCRARYHTRALGLARPPGVLKLGAGVGGRPDVGALELRLRQEQGGPVHLRMVLGHEVLEVEGHPHWAARDSKDRSDEADQIRHTGPYFRDLWYTQQGDQEDSAYKHMRGWANHSKQEREAHK
jgi:hypothetical protein